MSTLEGKKALVVGASRGVGQATLLRLAAQGMDVWGVARGAERLDKVAREAPGEVRTVAADATDPAVAARLVRDIGPDLVVLCAGTLPRVAGLDEQSWESFSAPWNTEVKMTFHFCQEALRHPLPKGSTVVVVSSGAAMGGSPLSGGYAGAKRMQWFLGDYAQRLSATRALGIRFVTLVPKQLVVGTTIAEAASAGYAALTGMSQAAYMDRFGPALVPDGVADAIVKIARGEIGAEGGAVSVTGKGVEAMPA